MHDGQGQVTLEGCESCATQYRAGGGSILGHVAEESALLSCQRARAAVVLVFGVARAQGVTLDHWSEEMALTAQLAVAEVVTNTFGWCEIQPKGDAQKLTRC